MQSTQFYVNDKAQSLSKLKTSLYVNHLQYNISYTDIDIYWDIFQGLMADLFHINADANPVSTIWYMIYYRQMAPHILNNG